MKAISFATICVLSCVYRADCQVTVWTEPDIATPEGSATATVALAEDISDGATTLQVAATGAASYALGGHVPATPGTFAVAADGVVSITGPLDFELVQSYELEIVATATGDGSFATAFVTIEITDVNDESPVFDQLEYGACMDHGAGTDAVVLSVTATDADAGDTIAYTITNGNTGTDFEVDGSTGQITVLNALDKARTVSYTLELTATDGASNTGTADVYIVVTDDTSDAVAIMSGMFVTTVAFLVARFL